MKKMLLGCMTALAVTVAAYAHEDAYNMFIYAIHGPLRASTNAPVLYPTWSTNMVWKLYTQGSLDGDDVGHRLMTSDLILTNDLSGNALWFAVKVTGKSGAKVSLNQLRFVERSSDPGDIYSNVYDLSSITNLIYTPRAIGVIWSTNGPRVSDALLLNNESATNLVDEIDFIGMQSTYSTYSSSAQYANDDAWIQGFTNLFLSASCSVVGSNSVVGGLCQKTLQTKGDPFVPILTIFGNPSLVWVGSVMEQDSTIKLYHASNLKHPVWTFVGTFNPNDVHYQTNDNLGFFRAILE